MNKTKIEWCDYTLNPVKGLCPMGCSYCYARAMYKRFKWDTDLRFEYKVFENLNLKDMEPARIFVGSTIELFGDWVPTVYMKMIFNYVAFYPQHTFIFLTKQPQNLARWSPFPDNCWVGCSSTGDLNMTAEAFAGLSSIKAKVKFISLEPLLSKNASLLSDYFDVAGINWVIIGQQTPASKKTTPRVEWINEIVRACDAAHIPVFLKDNLNSLPFPLHSSFYNQVMTNDGPEYELRQEFPQIKVTAGVEK